MFEGELRPILDVSEARCEPIVREHHVIIPTHFIRVYKLIYNYMISLNSNLKINKWETT